MSWSVLFTFVLLQLFVGVGQNKLENQHSHSFVDPLYLLQSSFCNIQHIPVTHRSSPTWIISSHFCSWSCHVLITNLCRYVGEISENGLPSLLLCFAFSSPSISLVNFRTWPKISIVLVIVRCVRLFCICIHLKIPKIHVWSEAEPGSLTNEYKIKLFYECFSQTI